MGAKYKTKTLEIADPDAPLRLKEAAELIGVTTQTVRRYRPALSAAGARMVSPTQWEITPRHMETAGLLRIRKPKTPRTADPLEAAQKAREEQRAEAARLLGDRAAKASRGTAWQAAVDAAADRIADAHTAPQAAPEAPGSSDAAVTIAELKAELERARHAAELAAANHRAELAEERRKTAEANAVARASQDRAATLELLANERGQTIAMLQAMLTGQAPVTRALDA